MSKRVFDILLSISGLIITSPLFLIIALMIKLGDGGPVFFTQERIGRYGKKFHIYKFRSMSVLKSAEKGQFDPGNKSRITKIGSLIRETKLDELPQLINVFRGKMSFVGARPEVDYWVNTYPEKWTLIHQVKPGMTDNASIEFRNEEENLAKSTSSNDTYRTEILPKKLALYEEYVRTRSFIGDIKIILRTIFVVITKKN